MRYLISLILICSFLTGCRTNPRAEREIALLRAEILDLEDQYYSLKDRCEGAGVTTANGSLYDSGYIDGECLNCEPGMIVYDNPADVVYGSAPQQSTPSGDYIEYGEPTLKATTPAENDIPSQGSGSRLEIIPNSGQDRLPEKVSYPLSGAISQDAISAITINRQFSRGEDIDGLPGHEGVSLLIQPIDDNGNVHKIAGKVTVRLSESKSQNVERQIGQWHFSPRETASFFVKDEFAQQGILLHLPWDGLLPSEQLLNVSVRYTTRDNRGLNATYRIRIDPPGQNYTSDDPLIASWIEKDERWMDVEFEALNDLELGGGLGDQRQPDLRAQPSSTQRRVSAPGWRPVR